MKPPFVSTAAPRTPRGLWQLLDAFAAHGLGCVELGASELGPEPALAQRLRGTGLVFVIHNYFPPPADAFVLNLASADAEIARRSRELVADALELSAALEAPYYSVHSGWITDPIGFDGTSFILPEPEGQERVDAAWQRFLDGIGGALDRGEELGVRLLVENSVCTDALVGKLLLMQAAEFEALFDAFADRNLGMLLDTGHLNVTARTLDFDRTAFVDVVAPHIEAFHLHDNDSLEDLHRPATSDSWALDVVRRPQFGDATVCVEASFDSVPALAAYVRTLERIRVG